MWTAHVGPDDTSRDKKLTKEADTNDSTLQKQCCRPNCFSLMTEKKLSCKDKIMRGDVIYCVGTRAKIADCFAFGGFRFTFFRVHGCRKTGRPRAQRHERSRHWKRMLSTELLQQDESRKYDVPKGLRVERYEIGRNTCCLQTDWHLDYLFSWLLSFNLCVCVCNRCWFLAFINLSNNIPALAINHG